ncbi:MAG: large conductance mechanosensitive channel protein MscL [Lachnospiraceae bacterium]|nr:large conductance mechanosensitive channel protein MscL [Lachnospiraceae bacterium]
MWKEFKEFALKGNMFDMAVGIIIGGAFSTIINSLVSDIIMPVVGMFIGGTDFANLFIALDGNKYESLAAAQEAGASVFAYGSFIQNVINFILLALVVFFLVRTVNKLRKPAEAPAAPETKECPFCKSQIAIAATKCPNCTSVLPEYEAVPDAE